MSTAAQIEASDNPRTLGISLALISGVLFALYPVSFRYADADGTTTMTVLAYRFLLASLASILSMTELVATALYGVFVFGELLQPLQWVGGALVIVAIVMLSLRQP